MPVLSSLTELTKLIIYESGISGKSDNDSNNECNYDCNNLFSYIYETIVYLNLAYLNLLCISMYLSMYLSIYQCICFILFLYICRWISIRNW